MDVTGAPGLIDLADGNGKAALKLAESQKTQ
jgi:hypothetical protein